MGLIMNRVKLWRIAGSIWRGYGAGSQQLGSVLQGTVLRGSGLAMQIRLTLREMFTHGRLFKFLAIVAGLLPFSASVCAARGEVPTQSDVGTGYDWPSYGRAYAQNHYSPLAEITSSNVFRLGLAWWFDIPGVVLAQSEPLEVNNTLYFVTGYSVVRAVDATTGSLLWSYDPHVYEVAGRKMQFLWGVRGLAFRNNKIFVGTHDGRLLALDAKSGAKVWSVSTTQPGDLRIISGPPLVFGSKVMIGHGFSEAGPLRGYVTAYDAETGRKVWRFFTVPGDLHRGFENKAMEMAARSWTGNQLKYGGGGAVWNAMTYDSELNRVYIGTSNGTPTNADERSPGGGDNLFLASIVALDADKGSYLWHYQTNPRETWDYDAATDIELARLTIDGVSHRVLMQASKNGFFYVVDRDSGKLLSAENFVRVTWATKVDLESGRPVEVSGARDPSNQDKIWPSGDGAHSWAPMAFNHNTGLVYIPALDAGAPGKCDDRSIVVNGFICWGVSTLIAWNPARKAASWKVRLPGVRSGGVATTAGNLVFQGRADGKFVAYAADTGRELWSFDAAVGITGAPITYEAAGHQYVSIVAGYGGAASELDPRWDARRESRRVLTFALDGKAELPPAMRKHTITPVSDPTFKTDAAGEAHGSLSFAEHCQMCHGSSGVAGGAAPDLRESPAILSAEAFRSIVKEGRLLSSGMPRFRQLTEAELESLRQYLRSRAKSLSTSDG